MANVDDIEIDFSEDTDEVLLNLEEIEQFLQQEIDEELSGLDILKDEKDSIGDPDKLGETMKNIIWEQFLLQLGVTAGEEFYHENGDMRLDLSEDAHFLKTDNFADGKMPSHNPNKEVYQKRYDDWQANFVKDENGNVVTHTTRSGKEEATLVKGARNPFDKDRPKGNAEKHTDMDHTISAAEIIRDAEANAHMTKEEQIAFANSDANLNEMDSAWNRSKSDKSMTDWLDNPNTNGQKPDEIFDISVEDEQQLRKKDDEARSEYEKQKNEAEQRSVQEGKQSRKEEALRVGKHAAKAVLFQLLAALVKDVIAEFVKWIKSKNKSFNSFIEIFKNAIIRFVSNLKQHLINAADMALTVIAEAIFGPIVRIIKRVWMLLKQGVKSFKEAIDYLKTPGVKDQPLDITIMQIGKIVMAGVSAIGSVGLTQLIETGLTALGTYVPALVVEIPVIGSLASVIGIFLGGLISGVIGALVMMLFDSAIKNMREEHYSERIIDHGNNIMIAQQKLFDIKDEIMSQMRDESAKDIISRHDSIDKRLEDINKNLLSQKEIGQIDYSKLDTSMDDIMKRLSTI